MVSSVMTTNNPTISKFVADSKVQATSLSQCTLRWRQRQLWVCRVKEAEQVYIPSLTNKQRVVECLKLSSVNLVCLDPALGANHIQFWTDVCQQASKPLYLRLKTKTNSPRRPINTGLKPILAGFAKLLSFIF